MSAKSQKMTIPSTIHECVIFRYIWTIFIYAKPTFIEKSPKIGEV